MEWPCHEDGYGYHDGCCEGISQMQGGKEIKHIMDVDQIKLQGDAADKGKCIDNPLMGCCQQSAE